MNFEINPKWKKILIGLFFAFVLIILIANLTGQFFAAHQRQEILLTVLCEDKKNFEDGLNALKIPPVNSKYPIPNVENRDELWKAMKESLLNRCGHLELYPAQ